MATSLCPIPAVALPKNVAFPIFYNRLFRNRNLVESSKKGLSIPFYFLLL